MWQNNVKISFRNLKKHKSLTVINVLGMAVGLAACLLIGLFIFDELSYDQHVKDGERIYRVALETADSKWAGSPGPLAEGLRSDFAEVENSTRIMKFPELDQMLLKSESNGEVTQFYESKGYYVDSTFFQVFEYEFLTGLPSNALKAPNSVILSASLARKFFGEADPMNQPLTIGLPFGDFDYTITGVFEDTGVKSHVDANFFLSMENNDIGNAVKGMTNWATNNIFYTYVKLLPNTDTGAFEEKLIPFFDRHGAEDLKAMGSFSKSLFLQPLTAIYLSSSIDYELGVTGNMTTLYVFGSVAGFILLIACINFMNLATARSEKRSKEVGIRKLLGAKKNELIRQFLGESLIISVLGLIMAFLLASLLMPYFNQLTGKDLELYQRAFPLLAIFILAIAAGLLAGIYPAFFLSAFTPSTVLKGRFKGRLSGFSLRQVLVVFQFAISACLILMVFVIKNQLDFVQNQDLGFKKDQQLILPLKSEDAVFKYDVLKTSMMQNPNVKSVTLASTYPGIESIEDMMYYADGKTVEDVVNITNAYVGDDFVETLGFQLLEGRTFTEEYTSEYPMMILNESAIKSLGYEVAEAVGRKIHFEWRGELNTLEIVGVVKDFNYQSLHTKINPYAFIKQNRGGYLIANFVGSSTNDVLAAAKSGWDKFNIADPFVYSFLDQDFQRNYEKEERVANIIIGFALLAIFIACLGLYGLTAFMTEQRTKEIGIRKTMGATDWSIVALLSKDFGKTVLLAILISVPISLYLSNAWLENFAFKIELQWWYFAVTGLVALMIAMITVSFQSVRTALMNPVESLKSE
ncbi:putative ABC transport system permease protein [Algoriphagus sp. 4150]|uniref:ABC transporter permease n=1 Tax=Algoriphagus sp. 4150 TaxID=2817756 RepID=UPI00285EFB9A|nr:ABC transporter permease [Algoriphagus sp. 4150]MDR7132471.1 putative ABC transport system permease protein [Algoriphagus sp. 4150]